MLLHYNSTDGPYCLLADLGGTHIRLALARQDGSLHAVQVWRCADFTSLQSALLSYLKQCGVARLRGACLAVAAAVDCDVVTMLNLGWQLERTELSAALGCPIQLINDFTAQALSIDVLEKNELRWLNDCRPASAQLRCVLGPGTGFGLAVLLPDGQVLPSEGGHVGFAPQDLYELQLLQTLWRQHEHVSIERLLSGVGLSFLYAQRSGSDAPAAEVSALAGAGDHAAQSAINDFVRILGSAAGDAAIAHWARGGVFIAGGMLPKLWGLFEPATLRSSFCSKGRLRSFCEQVPLAMIDAAQPGLRGAYVAWQRGLDGI